MDVELRTSLLRLIRYKFASFPNVALLADDIVQDAYLALRTCKHYTPEKVNYGYLSVVSVRLAYRAFIAQTSRFKHMYLDYEGPSLIDEADIVDDLLQAEDSKAVLESLIVLREIERIVVTQRYYNDFTFAEIARQNGLKLNTVLSHHRRALGKLRPQLTKLLGYGKEQSYEQNIMETGSHKRAPAESGDAVRDAGRRAGK